MAGEINLNHICKIEGHANLKVKIENGKIKECNLEAYEGARFFEALVLGKNIRDIQEIVSRICGICSCSHSVCAIQALENCLGVKPTEKEKALREILVLAERIRSHATHLYFLALPDYHGESAIMTAKHDKQKLDDALEIITLGNKIIETHSGREMHPFVKFNSENVDFENIKKELEEIKPVIKRTIALFSNLKYPDFSRKINFSSLAEEKTYASISGKISCNGKKFESEDYGKHLKENIKEYSTSKFVLMDNKPYLLGAISRINNNHEKLDEDIKKEIREHHIQIPFTNPFHNNIAQALELMYLVARIEFLIKKLKNIKDDGKKEKEFKIKAGKGVAAIEAPRGTLFHEYEIDSDGKITYCNIITPTCQNLNQMEIDIKDYMQTLLNFPKGKIVLEIEKLIRAYDPCFSCSTHFLEVEWEES